MLDTSESQENKSETSGGGEGRSSILADVLTIAMSLFGSPVVIGVAGFVLGLVLGLVMGWWIWPVDWVNATPQHLRADLQDDWVRMTVELYYTESEATALRRLQDLGPEAVPAMDRVALNPGLETPEMNQSFLSVLADVRDMYAANTGLGASTGGGAGDAGGETGDVAPDGEEEGQPASGGGYGGLMMACAFTALLGVALALVIFMRRRGSTPREATKAQQAQEISEQAKMTDYVAMGHEPPIAQWMTTYLKGDDLFDDSFSIDSPAGEFMGECGVGIADTVGVGEPKRVSAFEVWLFDKDDIQTVTKVIMSQHLFNDEASKGRLAAKGEPMQAGPGAEITLETETLQMVVRVVDMAYGAGAAPDASFFERVTLELSIWKK